MHIADVSTGMLGANGVVGASVPLACGAALKTKVKGGAEVAVAFFGDGGSSQGIIHESMNLASIWKLPVIFVCENNLYAESTPVEYSVSVENVADRAAGYSMPGLIADGMDVFHVYELAAQAVQRARDGLGPTLLECKTYRYYGHYAGGQSQAVPHRGGGELLAQQGPHPGLSNAGAGGASSARRGPGRRGRGRR